MVLPLHSRTQPYSPCSRLFDLSAAHLLGSLPPDNSGAYAAAQPLLVTPLLQIMHRVITRHLLDPRPTPA